MSVPNWYRNPDTTINISRRREIYLRLESNKSYKKNFFKTKNETKSKEMNKKMQILVVISFLKTPVYQQGIVQKF